MWQTKYRQSLRNVFCQNKHVWTVDRMLCIQSNFRCFFSLNLSIATPFNLRTLAAGGVPRYSGYTLRPLVEVICNVARSQHYSTRICDLRLAAHVEKKPPFGARCTQIFFTTTLDMVRDDSYRKRAASKPAKTDDSQAQSFYLHTLAQGVSFSAITALPIRLRFYALYKFILD